MLLKIQNPVVDFIFQNSLKLKGSDAETVTSNEDIQPTKVGWASVDITVSSRLRVLTGFLLRDIKKFWRLALLMSTLLYEIDSTEDLLSKSFQLDKLKDIFKAAESTVIELGLDKVWDVKALVDGNEIMNVLELKPGPLVGEWKQKLLAWQLAHPSGSAEECLEWMKQSHSKRLKME
ncbi:hypothetical protein TorRG33x02_010820 [Trema orientale]|uniref:Poly A polymerase, head domain containing protein n=1 Tax=Trema orientale TaxID=63057 RepID=A0A2P5FZ06_TREOI|nr:hypothetical protein TorRG33x02_010820 [Trema orientale]